jgi:hypothetical protein
MNMGFLGVLDLFPAPAVLMGVAEQEEEAD